jgi:hypothetical protein
MTLGDIYCTYCGIPTYTSSTYCSELCQMKAFNKVKPVHWPAPVDIRQSTVMGCICPPTSEQTCQNSLCPRKGVTITA